MGLSRVYSGCRKCPYMDTCDHKRMEALGYLPGPIAAQATETVRAELVQPMMAAHKYRDIKVAEGMTVTIDLEELKQKMVEDFYRNINMLSQG